MSKILLKYFDTLASTQQLLCKEARLGNDEQRCYLTFDQSAGIGSRDNEWLGKSGNIYFSFLLKKDALPGDLPSQSMSIYFGMIMKDELSFLGSKVWLKWPNDFYLQNTKIGGIITNIIKENVIVGIGINVAWAPKNASVIDIKLDKKSLVQSFLQNEFKKISWKDIFSKFVLDFHKNKNYTVHLKGKKIALKDAVLHEDGSISINRQRVFSTR